MSTSSTKLLTFLNAATIYKNRARHKWGLRMGNYRQSADVKRKHYGRPSIWWLVAAFPGVFAAATFIGVWGAMAGMPDQAIETTGRLLGLPLMFLFGFKGYTMVQDSGGNNVTAAFAALASAILGFIAIGVIHLAIREPRDKGPGHVAGPAAATAGASGIQTKDDRYSRDGMYK